MSQTRMFKMGHADVFQDKPSEETKRAIEIMHKQQHERISKDSLVLHSLIVPLTIELSKLDESKLIDTINIIVRDTKTYKQNGK